MTPNLRNFTIWVVSVLLILAVFTLLWNRAERSVSQDISFSQLLRDVDQRRVREVIIQGQEIRGTYADGRGFSTYAPNDPTLVQRLYSKDVVITARPVQDNVPWFVSLLVSWLPFVALIGVWIFLSRRIRSADGSAPRFWKRGTMSATLLDDPKYWRERADEARAIAEKLADPESRRRMLEIANGYEYLALKVRLADSENSK